MSFLDVFRTSGRRLTEAEDMEMNGGETPVQRLKRIKAEVAQETERKTKEAVETVLPEVYSCLEAAIRKGDKVFRVDRLPPIKGSNYSLTTAILLELEEQGIPNFYSKSKDNAVRYLDLGNL